MEALIQLGTARFQGQPDDLLLATSVSLFGLAKTLQVVGQSQIECMEAWLDPERCRNLPDTLPRSQHRAAGIYREFWGLEYIIHNPSPLQAILRGFHDGSTRVAGNPTIAPAFDAFRRRADKIAAENNQDISSDREEETSNKP